MDTFRIDEIARRLLERVPPALRSMQADLESNVRAVLRQLRSPREIRAAEPRPPADLTGAPPEAPWRWRG